MSMAENNGGKGTEGEPTFGVPFSKRKESDQQKLERYRSALEQLSKYVAHNGDTWVQEIANEALEGK